MGSTERTGQCPPNQRHTAEQLHVHGPCPFIGPKPAGPRSGQHKQPQQGPPALKTLRVTRLCNPRLASPRLHHHGQEGNTPGTPQAVEKPRSSGTPATYPPLHVVRRDSFRSQPFQNGIEPGSATPGRNPRDGARNGGQPEPSPSGASPTATRRRGSAQQTTPGRQQTLRRMRRTSTRTEHAHTRVTIASPEIRSRTTITSKQATPGPNAAPTEGGSHEETPRLDRRQQPAPLRAESPTQARAQKAPSLTL